MNQKRFMELEGLRGIAAIAVVFWHFAFAFYPTLTTGNPAIAHTPFELYIFGSLAGFLYAGTFAVAIFFVLSGFVLSIGFFKTGDENIVKKLATSRYLRLVLPALASVIGAYLLMKIGFAHIPVAVGKITGSEAWLNSWNFHSSFPIAIKSAMVDIFMSQGSRFNNVLWTMHTEFFGSFMVFTFLMFFAKSKYRWIIYLGIAFCTFNTWYLPFTLGLILADIYAHGYIEKMRKIYVVAPLLLCGLFLGSFPHTRITGTLFAPLLKLPLTTITGAHVQYDMFYLTVGAFMVVTAVLLGRRISKVLAAPRIAVIGKYTFSLYLTHLLVLYTFTCSIFLILLNRVGYNRAVLTATLLSIPVIWIVTILFERYIDMPSIRFARYVGIVMRGELILKRYEMRHKIWLKFIAITEKYIGISGDPKRSYPQDD